MTFSRTVAVALGIFVPLAETVRGDQVDSVWALDQCAGSDVTPGRKASRPRGLLWKNVTTSPEEEAEKGAGK